MLLPPDSPPLWVSPTLLFIPIAHNDFLSSLLILVRSCIWLPLGHFYFIVLVFQVFLFFTTSPSHSSSFPYSLQHRTLDLESSLSTIYHFFCFSCFCSFLSCRQTKPFSHESFVSAGQKLTLLFFSLQQPPPLQTQQ